METLDQKILKLIILNGEGKDSFIFTEYYSHTRKIMFKINNTYTHYNKEILVLCEVNAGFEHAVDLAIEQIEIAKAKFFEYDINKASNHITLK